jgi:3-hydroxyisobutyrate dehydrogenase-like beta-hydroxyacid dehydrogenase
MGAAMASRLIDTGHQVHVFNRTRSKLDGLVKRGAIAVDAPVALAGCSIVFVTVGGDDDLVAVVDGESGILAGKGEQPSVVVDFTTVSAHASAAARRCLAERGTAMLAAPVSGNAKVIEAGLMSVVASGPYEAFVQASPYLETLARRVVYVGEGEKARLVKICHNLYLGLVIQSLIEVTVLAEKAGITRHDLLEFINTSVMGSVFTRYKTPALVNLDFTPTFTLELLLKDISLAVDAAEELGVQLMLGSQLREIVHSGIADGHSDEDFAALIKVAAGSSGLELVAEDVVVPTGLEGVEPAVAVAARTP